MWRWGISWRPLRMPFLKRPLVIQTACMLHNLCRAYGDMPVTQLSGSSGSHQALWENDNSDLTGPRPRGKGSVLRRRMAEVVKNSGRMRPPVHGS